MMMIFLLETPLFRLLKKVSEAENLR